MPGLDDFDVSQASQNLAQVGRPPAPEQTFTPPTPNASLGTPQLQQPINVLPILPQGGAPAPVPAPSLTPPTTPEDAAARQYTAANSETDIANQQVANTQELANIQEQNDAKKAALLAQQTKDQAAEDERQRKGLEAGTRERDALRQSVKDFKFHSMWDDKTAAQELLGGIGILLGSYSYDPHHQNQAVDLIDKAAAREFDQQKEELNQRFRMAQEKGEDLNQLQQQYQLEQGRLKLRQESQLNALAAQLESLSSRSKNKAGVLTAQKLAANARAQAEKLGAEGVKAVGDSHSQKIKDEEAKSATVKNYAEAARARADKSGDKQTKAEQLANATVDRLFEKEKDRVEGTTRSPGPLKKLSMAESVIDGVRNALASGDPAAIKEALISAREQATRTLTGSAPTKVTVELQSELQSSPDAFTAKLSHLLGKPTEAKAFANRVIGLFNGIAEEQRKQVDDERGRITSEWVGRNGKAGRSKIPALNEAAKKAALGNIDNMFSQVRNADGTRRYIESDDSTAVPAKKGTAPATQAPASKLSDVDAAALRAVPKTDPRYGQAQAVLKANGK